MAEAGQAGGQRVGLQMVDGEVGPPGCDGGTLGEAGADQQPADESGAGGGGDGGEVVVAKPGLSQRRRDQSGQGSEMRAGGDFRHHAAERRMVGELAQHQLRHDPSIRGQDGGGGLIAGALDPENRAGEGVVFSFHD